MSSWGGALNGSQQYNQVEAEEYECISTYRVKSTQPVLCMHVADGVLYAGTNGGEVLVWDVGIGEENAKQKFLIERNAPLRAIYAHQGVLHIGIDTRVLYVDARTGVTLFVGEREGSKGLVATIYFKQGLVYAGYTDGSVRVWKDGEWKGSYRGHQGTVLCLTIIGREMFTGSKDQTIMTWNLREAKPHVIWRGKLPQNGPIRGIEVHRGTVWFADGNRVLAQNIATGTRVFKCEGHQTMVKRIALHAPTDTLYSIAEDKSIRAWDTNTGAQKAVLSGHTAVLNALCIDDRGFVFTTAADNTVREWATPSLIAGAEDGQTASRQRESSFESSTAFPSSSRDSVAVDDPPKPRKAAPRRAGSVATITKADRDSSSGGTPSASSSGAARGGGGAAPPKKEAPKRNAAPAAKAADLEELEPLDEQVPLDKIDDIKESDWDDIDNLLDFGDL